jgi:hypothetical protein
LSLQGSDVPVVPVPVPVGVAGVFDGVDMGGGGGVYAGLVEAEPGAVRPVGRGRQRREVVGDADRGVPGGVGVDVGVGVDMGVEGGVVCPGSPPPPESEPVVGVCAGGGGGGSVEDGVGSLSSPHPASVLVALGVDVGVGVEDGVGSSSSPHPSSVLVPLGVDDGVGVDKGVVGVGVVGGGATDPGVDGVPDDVGGGTDPGVVDPELGVLDGVGGVLVGEAPPEVVVAFPVTNCAASVQNAINKLTLSV